jgi:quercetin dioxygenase-like cupin family protein
MTRVLALAGLITVSGCASPHATAIHSPTHRVDPAMISAMVKATPVGDDEARRAATLVVGADFSMHLLQFRTGEDRHIHRTHDLTFVVHRGEGRLTVDDRACTVQPGDVIHIPRGTPHSCTNRGSEPLVAVLIFTPPYDLKDSIPVPAESRSYERE